MIEYNLRMVAQKHQAGAWEVWVHRSRPGVPIATWSRTPLLPTPEHQAAGTLALPELYRTEVQEELIYNREYTQMNGCGPKWQYEAFARRVGRQWRIWSTDHSATSKLFRPALNAAYGVAS
jgi:hypothetical protein